ncbi:MAG TPA: LysR family transcriptional regulator [Steroidobacteraceae bacterium]|jgi:LysR family hydrogen peroxide-inducible transcriptional activator|nr:LysR family transcriptional regulator [Steroidobacteraceae bacterium]
MTKNPSIGFSFRELQYVVAVAEELSFHKAALRCCVSQSTLSIQLKKCESYLGISLFTRTHHSVALTPVGVEVVAFARVALEAAQLIKERAVGKPATGEPTRRTSARVRLKLARTVLDLKDQSRLFLRRA